MSDSSTESGTRPTGGGPDPSVTGPGEPAIATPAVVVARRKLRRLLLLLWLALLTTIVLALAWKSSRSAQLGAAAALPIVKEAPEFSLQNRDGTTVDLDRLAGKPWVADFIFTSCPGVCPILTSRLADIAAEAAPEQVNFVSISVDPENDTPEVLQAYALDKGAGDNWYFLTGPKNDVYSVIREGFLLVLDPAPQAPPVTDAPAATDSPKITPDSAALEGPVPEPIVHSNRFVLVDAEGQIRGYYNAFDEADLQRLRVDLDALITTSRR